MLDVHLLFVLMFYHHEHEEHKEIIKALIGIFQQAQKVVYSFSAFRSHAPAWECIPYGFPRWSMGTRQPAVEIGVKKV